MNILSRHHIWTGIHKPWTIFAIATLFIIAVCLLFVFFMKAQPWGMDKRGQFGDMFGVLGAVFYGLYFASLVELEEKLCKIEEIRNFVLGKFIGLLYICLRYRYEDSNIIV